jgi:hypothetical protein
MPVFVWPLTEDPPSPSAALGGETLSAIRKVRASLLIRLAESPWLYRLGPTVGVPNPPFPIPDEMYRRLVMLLAWQPKMILFTMYKLMEVVFGSQASIIGDGGRPWRIYEVNVNEFIVELPNTLIATSNESASYLHGWHGYAAVITGPSNQFTTEDDVRQASVTTLVGRNVYVYYASAWHTYTIAVVTYNAGTNLSTITVSASTVPTGGGLFYIDVPGDDVASYRGDYLASSGFAGVFSTGAGPTDTILVIGDATRDLVVGQGIALTVAGVALPYTVATISYDQVTNLTTIQTTVADIPGGLSGAGIVRLMEKADRDGAPGHADRVYLTGHGLFELAQFYIDRLVRAAGIVMRIEIL